MSLMKRLSPFQPRPNAQAGIASLIITLLLMVVISLIVLGFSQVARREQRNALDRQLSTQANYAAESGINDAVKAIQDNIVRSQPIVSKTTCDSTNTGYSLLNPVNGVSRNVIDKAHDVSYSCLLINPNVVALQKTLATDGDWAVPVNPVDSAGKPGSLNSLKISWPKGGIANDLSQCPQQVNNNQPDGAWPCSYAVARIELIPTSGNGPITRQSLTANDMVVFAYPNPTSGSGGTVHYQTNQVVNQGSSQFAKCTSSGCSVTIDNLPSGQVNYYARVRLLYQGTNGGNVSITDPGKSNYFASSQVQLDATGKAQDVLRRIRVNISLSDVSNVYPQFAIQTRDSICKRYSVAPNYFLSDGVDATDPLCAKQLAAPGGNSSGTGGANLNAAFTQSCTGACTGTSDSDDGPRLAVGWGRTFYNQTKVADDNVKSCSWSFGDGTEASSNAPSANPNSNAYAACLQGQAIYHKFPPGGGDFVKCYTYTVTLKVTVKSGPQPAPYSQTITTPRGTAVPDSCS